MRQPRAACPQAFIVALIVYLTAYVNIRPMANPIAKLPCLVSPKAQINRHISSNLLSRQPFCSQPTPRHRASRAISRRQVSSSSPSLFRHLIHQVTITGSLQCAVLSAGHHSREAARISRRVPALRSGHLSMRQVPAEAEAGVNRPVFRKRSNSLPGRHTGGPRWAGVASSIPWQSSRRDVTTRGHVSMPSESKAVNTVFAVGNVSDNRDVPLPSHFLHSITIASEMARLVVSFLRATVLSRTPVKLPAQPGNQRAPPGKPRLSAQSAISAY